MTEQVCADGFVCGRRAYLSSGWNIMDGCLVVISLVDIIVSMSASHSPRIFAILRVFRLLRTLRPLRYYNDPSSRAHWTYFPDQYFVTALFCSTAQLAYTNYTNTVQS